MRLTSEGLKDQRPSYVFGDVLCNICNQPCEFDITGAHNLWGKPDSAGYTRGKIIIRAYCHNEEADIIVTFEQARKHKGEKIIAFEHPVLEGPIQPALPPSPHLLEDSSSI